MDQGGSKIQEAYLIFQDLSERYQSTSLLLNGKAVCCMHMGNFDEAETLLVEALNKACFTYLCIIHFYGFDDTIDIASCLQFVQDLKLLSDLIKFKMISVVFPFCNYSSSGVFVRTFKRDMINIHTHHLGVYVGEGRER